jgi:hypothetical protein
MFMQTSSTGCYGNLEPFNHDGQPHPDENYIYKGGGGDMKYLLIFSWHVHGFNHLRS